MYPNTNYIVSASVKCCVIYYNCKYSYISAVCFIICYNYSIIIQHICYRCIREYGSTVYVGMARKENGRPYISIASDELNSVVIYTYKL